MKHYWRMKLGLIALALTCTACGGERQYVPEVDTDAVKVEVVRFEQLLFGLDTNNLAAELKALEAKYPDFSEVYFSRIVPIYGRPNPVEHLKGYLQFQPAQEIYDTVQQAYPELDDIEQEAASMLAFRKYYFPERPIPQLFSCNSEYAYNVFLGPSFIGFALDNFLGPQHKDYYSPQVNQPMYLTRTYTKEHIVPRMAYVIADDIVGPPTGPRLIDQMINEGKRYFLVKSFLPYTHDTLIYAMPPVQIATCEQGEKSLYEVLSRDVEGGRNLLYEDDPRRFRKFIEPGPFNPKSPSDLPGGSAAWLGAQMVMQYAERLRENLQSGFDSPQARDQALVQAVLKENDVKAFLSKYKPRK